ncbi:MAG: hypothetical protein ACO3G9_09240, partial [Chthoniobacterales bacterium]
MHSLLRAAALAVAVFLSPGAAGAPKERPIPPMGETQTVTIMRGGSAVVTLQAHEGLNNPLEYRILEDRLPRHGTLSDFRQADPNSQGYASVVYTHGDDEDSNEDEFAFKARSMGGGVSSAIAVKVLIVDKPPRLSAPPRVEFSAIAGEHARQVIGLTNTGGGILEGRFELEDPLQVEGDGRFRLRRGESTKLVFHFSPQSVESLAPQKITPAPDDPATTIVFSAEATAPFAAGTASLELNENDGSREGQIVVTNFRSLPLEVSLAVEPAGMAEIPAKRQIAAGAAAEIPVRIGPDKKSGAFDFSVRIADQFHALDLPMQAPPVPPRLELLTKELDFRESREATLEVRNSGGVDGRFTLELPEGMKALAGAANFTVAPGTTEQIALDCEPSRQISPLIVDLGKSGREEVVVIPPLPPPRPPAPNTPTIAGKDRE